MVTGASLFLLFHNCLRLVSHCRYLNWGNQAIKGVVDYDAVASAWEGDYNQAVATDGQECGTRTRSAPVRIFIPDHTADKISLSVHTTESQWSGEEFGFTDVSINPLSLAVAPTGDWKEGAAKFDAANQDGWGGTSLTPAFCKNLAGDSLWVGADKNAVGAVVAKIFTKLPAHQALRVTMKYTFTQASGSQTAFVVADSHLVWQDKQSTASKQCSSADTITVEVDEVVLHEEDTVNIQVWGEVDGGGGSFKISDVTVEPIVLGEGRWTPDKSDFSKWSDGWDGTNLGTTFCANLGATILGGHNQLGGQDEVHKKYACAGIFLACACIFLACCPRAGTTQPTFLLLFSSLCIGPP